MQITSCGQSFFVDGIVPAGTVLHPPFAATLTDLTPPTAGGPANGEVGAGGVHGHRIEKDVRLKLEITDATGSEPTYPVLVQLALGGPRPGQVILDPDGARIACDVAAFTWHDRDDAGTLIAPNEEFEIGMGTLALYVGAAPDPGNAGQIIPVWGTAELLTLSAQAKVKINDVWADPLLAGYLVHPEPGKPDHFACWEDVGLPCGDVFPFWTGLFLEYDTSDAYHLEDALGNTTFGYTNTSATSPGVVTVTFADQTAGDRGDPAGYSFDVHWSGYPSMPTGTLTSTVSVAYPDDPDWGAGG